MGTVQRVTASTSSARSSRTTASEARRRASSCATCWSLKAAGGADVESKLSARPDEAFSTLLALTDTQAQKLFHVVTHGEWTLQLRPVTDPADSRDTVETDASVLRTGRARAAKRRARR